MSMNQTIEEKIKQRRRQMLVHSYIYYELNQNIISDSKWSKWAMELADLQREYPLESKRVEFYEDFKNWDGNSGAGLKYSDSVKAVANRLLNEHGTKAERKRNVLTQPKQKSKINARKLF